MTKLNYNMTIQYITWSPDTCGCQIQLSYDDTTDLITRTYTPTALIQVCANHEVLADDIQTRHDAINTEKMRGTYGLDI
jgi:hypothetical protein